MKAAIGIFALLGLAAALPTREKRAVACESAFRNVPNVCRNNPTGQVFFSHPTDPAKFLQCDIVSRMYIVQCPEGEVFNIARSGCEPPQQQQQTTPVYIPPRTLPPTTKAPVVVVTPQVPATNNNNNPCTAQSVARGQLYFEYPGDKTKFYECDLLGNPSVLSCANMLVWDQNILSCVYRMDLQTAGQVTPTPQISAGGVDNPCTAQALTSGRLFFPYPDQTKYIQCDLWGNAYLNSCPSKLIWNAYLETCYKPYAGK